MTTQIEVNFILVKTKDNSQHKLRDGTTMGRNNCDIIVNSPSADRLHCKFQISQLIPSIMDIDTIDGTYINNKRIATKKFVPIKVGDQIKVGPEKFILENRSPANSKTSYRLKRIWDSLNPATM